MDLTPEVIEATGKALVAIIAALGAVVATVVSGVTAYFTFKNRRDLHIAHDRIRDIKGEPLQHRHDPDARAMAAKACEHNWAVDRVDDIATKVCTRCGKRTPLIDGEDTKP